MLSALVFDFDGLIADTEWPEYQAVASLFDDHGLDYPPEHWVDCIGSISAPDWQSQLEQRVGRSIDRSALDDERRRRNRVLLEGLEPLPGVVALLDAAAAAGVTLAVASSSPRIWVEGHLERFGLRSRFAAVRTRDDVDQVKPAPDLYHAACAALGVAPSLAVALEDSAHGVTAALAAGMPVVAVPNRLTSYLDLSGASLQVRSLAEVDLARLGQLVGP